MFDPPKCANYGCENRVSRERWLWTPGSVNTCSAECAGKVANESRPPFIPELKKCLRCGRRLTTVQVHGGVECCSRSCARRLKIGEEIGEDVRIAPGDRWEKVAPKMTYTSVMRDQMVRNLYGFEIQRDRPFR